MAIIQARLGATRLPGKVLKTLGGKSVLAQVIARVRTCPQLDGVVVATTDQPADTAVADEARKCGAAIFRGSADDVLSRYHGAAQRETADVIVRVTADCPLYDGSLLDRMLVLFKQWNAEGTMVDYVNNTLEPTFPRGLDTEIFTFAALDHAHREAKKPYEREHVTPYIYQHPELFRLRVFKNDTDLSGHRWTLDTPEDWELIQAVYAALQRHDRIFGTPEVLNLLKERPELSKLNTHVIQKKLGA